MGSTKMKSNARRHPHAGKHFIVETGKLKGLTVKISDFLQNQFQGKSIKALSKRADIAPMIAQLEGRGFKVTETTLYAFGPDKLPLLLDDSEIQVQAKEKPKLKSIEGGKDDSREASGEDLRDAGGSGDEGRSVSSGETDTEVSGEGHEVTESDSEVGGGEGSTKPTAPRHDKPKAGTGSKDTKRNNRNGKSN